jgi:protein TonB
MPQWSPATLKKKPVKCALEINVGVELDTAKLTGEITSKVNTLMERMAFYPGGDDALMRYLSKNVHYPKDARFKGTQGRVVVSFVIDETGSVTDAKLVNDIGEGCGAEALRVVNAMPKWIPGRQNGNPVKVQFNLPISFQLAN